jgi:hypothetical protein
VSERTYLSLERLEQPVGGVERIAERGVDGVAFLRLVRLPRDRQNAAGQRAGNVDPEQVTGAVLVVELLNRDAAADEAAETAVNMHAVAPEPEPECFSPLSRQPVPSRRATALELAIPPGPRLGGACRPGRNRRRAF